MPNTSLVAPTPSAVGAPSVGPAPVQVPAQGFVPFRLATIERSENIGTTVATPGASEQVFDVPLPGTGYMYGLDIQAQATAAANAATVVFAEDGPYSALSSIILGDVTGQIINLPGWSLKQISRYGGWEIENMESSTDTMAFLKTAGSGGSGGSFNFHLLTPCALNRRDLIGLLGNQDRAQQYTLRNNVGTSASIWSTAPTTIPQMTITRTYDSYAVPNMVNESGSANQDSPATYGTIHYLTQTLADASPLGGSQVTHFVRRVGNSMRTILLVLRANTGAATPRATAEANLPTNIQLKIGDQVLFNETVASRRAKMWRRYGFDAPSGLIAYDWIHDFGQLAGAELGQDILWTENVTQMQFLIQYPSGFGSTSNSLTFITSDLIVPPGVDIYNP